MVILASPKVANCNLLMPIKLITIIGARPQIIKAAALSRAIGKRYAQEINEVIVHTGQHYDENMSKVFFDELQIPLPNYNLNVGSGNHGEQTSKMLEGLEAIFLKERPDGVVVYGDTNSTIAGALAASKLHIPVIHIEAGLRSFNKAMPEEINRISCDHMSTLLFTPTESGIFNLKKEGFNIPSQEEKASIDHPKVFHCGDIMYDNSLYFSAISDKSSNLISELTLEKTAFILCTIHRDSNTDNPEGLNTIIEALIHISKEYQKQIVLPLHPRTLKKMDELLTAENKTLLKEVPISIIPPAGFLDIIALEKHAELIITDSGGLQKEAFFFKKPCVILRNQTEWVEIVENGNAILAGSKKENIIAAYSVLSIKNNYTFPPFYGNGKAADFICEQILNELTC